MDCFVASAFRLRSATFGGRGRSLSYGGQVAPRNDGTPNSNTTPRSRGAMRPSFAKTVSPLLGIEGVGNAGCPTHPQMG